MEKYFREPINGLTHLFGAFLSLIALILMSWKAVEINGFGVASTAVIIFGLSLILLYSTSAIYHLVKGNVDTIKFLRRLDHSMIFVLIGGSYMPFYLILLQGKTRIFFTTLIVVLTLSGVLFKMLWFKCPRWLSTTLYIGMGWIAVIGYPLYRNLSSQAFFWLLLGGIVYTIGGVIYAIKPKFLEFKHLGFHEIFHIFILLGSSCHFISVFFYVL